MKKFLWICFFSGVLISCEKSDLPFPNNIMPDPIPIPVQEACVGGIAGIYPCDGYDLVRHLDFEALGDPDASGNDSWGWTDPLTLREYALMCLSTGTIFVDITDGINSVVIGKLPTNTTNSIWRDVKTYGNYAFIVSEAVGHGMQVFDLTRLRSVDPSNGPIEFTADAVYEGFGNAHNIVINENNAYAYAVGTTTFSGGPHIIDISDPLNPTAAGGYSSEGYSHDGHVVTYTGPDTDYLGSEIYIGSNENEVVIIDITNKSNPALISKIDYPNVGYTHQGWFTSDMRYFILGDETDELDMGFNTRTLVFDLIDLDNPTLHTSYSGPTEAIDHNGYVKGAELFLANYTAGIRIINVSDVSNMNEIAFFDTYPENDNTAFNGVWSVYPYFTSGNVVVSDINRGLFIIRKSP